MALIGLFGIILGIVALIVISYRGGNAFIASLAGAIIVIVANALPFWETFTGAYATALGNFIITFVFFFCIGSAFGELMKQSGAAETVAYFLFRFFGPKTTPLAVVIISLFLSYIGINAYIIVFVIYPIAVPMFKKANVSKALMPGLFLYGSVVLQVITPGNPSGVNATLAKVLGTSSFSAPVMGVIVLVVALAIAVLYCVYVPRRMSAHGEGFIPSESDALLLAGEETKKELPPVRNAMIPVLVIIVAKFALNNVMNTFNNVCTALLLGIAALIIFNYKHLKGHSYKDFTVGWVSGVSPMVMTASLMGFAAVVNLAPSFRYFIDFAMGLADKFNPYVSSAVCVSIFAGITGGTLTGVQIFINTMLEYYTALNINLESLHKIICLAAMSFDTLPHCPTVILMASICGVSVKKSYKHVFMLSVVAPIVLVILAILLTMMGVV
jgi:H+/gluconate symporter-like permease